MRNLTLILKDNKIQRIINGIIFLCLLIWIITKLNYVFYASGIMVHYKYYLLKLLTLMYLFQTILNRKWLNSMTKGFYATLAIYFIIAYIYSFFDENDYHMQKDYGVLIKSWETFIKLCLLFLILWFTNKITPIKKITI